MVPALVDAIKSHGLALVVDKSGEEERQPPQPQQQRSVLGMMGGAPPAATMSTSADPFPRLPKGVDGLLKSNGVLRFNESIDV